MRKNRAIHFRVAGAIASFAIASSSIAGVCLAAILDFAIVTIAHGANGSRIINNFTITNGNDTIDIRRSGFAVTVAHWASPLEAPARDPVGD
jgi:hypothetical protein